MARCPNCEVSVPIDAAECPGCKASFAAGSAWLPRPESRAEEHALSVLNARRNSQAQLQAREQERRGASADARRQRQSVYRIWAVFLGGIAYLLVLIHARVGGDDATLTAFFIPFFIALWWAIHPRLPDSFVRYWIWVLAWGFASSFVMTLLYILFQIFGF